MSRYASDNREHNGSSAKGRRFGPKTKKGLAVTLSIVFMMIFGAFVYAAQPDGDNGIQEQEEQELGFAPDHIINIAAPTNNPANGWVYDNLKHILTFTTAANGKKIELYGSYPGLMIVFSTGTDTEVLLNGIEIWQNFWLQGDATMKMYLNGTNLIWSSLIVAEGRGGRPELTGTASIIIDSVHSTPGNPSTVGTLTVGDRNNADAGGAGIGGACIADWNAAIPSAGNITINGGTIVATGSQYANSAGIGGHIGSVGVGSANCGNITINGGNVTATGGSMYPPAPTSYGYGAGIGGAGPNFNGGSITINGGNVTATGGVTGGAGIGGGGSTAANASPGTITINGGTVDATGRGGGAGIGGGLNNTNGGTVAINGGTVKATGSTNGAGIGNGAGTGTGSILTIDSSATVEAYSPGTRQAIHATSVAGGGHFVNAQLNAVISTTEATRLDVYAGANLGSATRPLVLPANFRNFAYSTGKTVAQDDMIFAYRNSTNAWLGVIVRNTPSLPTDNSPLLPSSSSVTVLPVKLVAISAGVVSAENIGKTSADLRCVGQSGVIDDGYFLLASDSDASLGLLQNVIESIKWTTPYTGVPKTASVSDLEPNTIYYIQTYVIFAGYTFPGIVASFATLPDITDGYAQPADPDEMLVNATFSGGDAPLTVKIYWDQGPINVLNLSAYASVTLPGSAYDSTGFMDFSVKGLIPSTVYNVAIVATNATGSDIYLTVFDADDWVYVELRSVPDGASLYYTMGTQSERSYTGPFFMNVNYPLALRASPTNGTDVFLRWAEGSKIIATETTVTGLMIPPASPLTVFTAVYADESDILTIKLDQTGGATATLSYAVNGTSYTYSDPFRVLRTDTLYLNASAFGSFEFVRWQDSAGNILGTTESATPSLSQYPGLSDVTMTAVFATSGNRVMVTLASAPAGASLHYTIGSLNEAAYAGAFPMVRSEALEIRAGAHGTNLFVRWESGSVIIGTTAALPVTLPASPANAVTYTAIYAATADILEISLRTDGTSATLSYTINGTAFQYEGKFIVLRADTVSVTASDFGSYEFVRWYDSLNRIVGTAPSSALLLSAYASQSSVTLTAVFAAPGDRVMVTLVSNPTGAVMYYTIGSLAEVQYTAAFPTERHEALSIRASSTHSGNAFLRWERAGTIISVTPAASVTLPASGLFVTYTAIYPASANVLIIGLDQYGGAYATLSYTINGTPFSYAGQFSVLRTDAVTVTTSTPSGYELVRWFDSERNIIGPLATETLNLSLYSGVESVIVVALFTSSGNRVTVTLASVPAGATLYYTIGALKEVTYAGAFPMERSEALQLRAPASHSWNAFLRWDGGGVIMMTPTASVTLPASGTSVTYTARFPASSDVLQLNLAQTGGASATLSYVVNSIAIPGTALTVLRTDNVLVSATVPSGFEFVRWQDSIDNIVGTAPQSTLTLPSYASQTSVTITAVFASSGNRVMVTLASLPSGASLHYTIGSLNETAYIDSFPMERNETLEIRAPASHSGNDFLRWNGPGGVAGTTSTLSVTLPSTGAAFTYTALYPSAAAMLTIYLQQTGGASATLSYTVNSSTSVYSGPFDVLRMGDIVSLSATVPSGYEFVRWQDSEGYILGLSASGTGTLDLSLYAFEPSVTITAVFAASGDRVMVSLASVPAGASLSYTIGALSETAYAGPFPMERNEALGLIAPSSYMGNDFLRWDGGGVIRMTPDASVTLPASGTSVTYTARYPASSAVLQLNLAQTGGASASLSYIVNSITIPYGGPLNVLRTDTVSVEASAFGSYEFVRWQDSLGRIVGTTALSALPLTPYASASSVTVTAVFASSGDRVMVTLASTPAGASLYYTIESLNEIAYAGAFPMERNEALDIRALQTHSGNNFLRWERAGAIISITPSASVTLPASGTSVTYTAIYPAASTVLIIGLQQYGGASAALSYTINGTPFPYAGQFSVIRSDAVTVTASDFGSYEFVRWFDSEKNIIGTLTTETLNLSLYSGVQSVIVAAMFASSGNLVSVTLASDPSGATLYYTIGSLFEYAYAGAFPMERNEALEIRAPITHAGNNFLRWEGGGLLRMTATASVTLPVTGTAVTYTAIYPASSAVLQLNLAQTGGASAELSYIVNGITVPYSGPLSVLRTDTVSVEASAFGSYEFVRWYDSLGDIVGTTALSALPLSPYASVPSVTITAVFASSGDRLMVTLTSVPAGALLYYTIGSLNEISYEGAFPIERSEALEIRAGDNGSNIFVRWESAGTIISVAESASVTPPVSGTSVTYTAVYGTTASILMIDLDQIGGAASTLSYIVNGTAIPYASAALAVLRTDNVSVSATVPSGYEFVRWYDSLDDIVGTTALSALVLSQYASETSVTMTAVFAASGDRVMVSLASDPTGASLYYTIGSLNECAYTGAFPMERNEALEIRAGDHGSNIFVRWESAGTIISLTASSPVSLPASGTAVTYTAVYGTTASILMIDLDQIGGAASTLSYIVNGTAIPYASAALPVLRTDNVSVSATVPSGFEFVRWYDSTDNIVGITPSSALALSSYASETSVTITAVFASSGDRVMVSLVSNPTGASLYYTIGSLNETSYEGAFPMERNEALDIRAGAHGANIFVRWESAGAMIGSTATLSVALPASGTSVTYTAIYGTSASVLMIDLNQTGGAASTLSYVVNGTSVPYAGTAIAVLRTDSVSVSATIPSGFEFVRWQDSLGNVAAIAASQALDLSWYAGVQDVTLTAVFASSGNRITVTLTSDPAGAPLYYTIGTLSEYAYAAAFPMERNEALTIRAAATFGIYNFLRWESASVSIGTTNAMPVTLPATGTSAAYTAIYVLPLYNVSGTITCTENGEPLGGVTVSYTINGSVGSVVSAADGRYTISVPGGSVFAMTGLSKTGYEATASNVYPSGVTMLSDLVQDLEMDLCRYDVNVRAEPNTTFTYTLDGVPGTFVTDASGRYTISAVPYGTVLVITAPDGYDAAWEYDIGAGAVRSAPGKTFTHTVRGPTSVTADLSMTEHGKDFGLALLLMGLAIASILLLMAIFLRRKQVLTGTVRQNGKGVAEVKIRYTVDGTQYTTQTDADGVYVIKGNKNADVTITEVGAAVKETLPITKTLSERRTELDFNI